MLKGDKDGLLTFRVKKITVIKVGCSAAIYIIALVFRDFSETLTLNAAWLGLIAFALVTASKSLKAELFQLVLYLYALYAYMTTLEALHVDKASNWVLAPILVQYASIACLVYFVLEWFYGRSFAALDSASGAEHTQAQAKLSDSDSATAPPSLNPTPADDLNVETSPQHNQPMNTTPRSHPLSIRPWLRGTAGRIIAVCVPLLMVWGTGWSFYRHGVWHGVMSLCIPPYAVYRGVAVLWESPEWKERYDAKTEQLATLIFSSVSDSSPQWQSKAPDYMKASRDWLRHMPTSERQKLRNASEAFSSALVYYYEVYLRALLVGQQPPAPQEVPIIQQEISQIRSLPGFSVTWDNMQRDFFGKRDLLEPIRGSSAAPVDPMAIRRFAQGLKERTDAMLASLFPKT